MSDELVTLTAESKVRVSLSKEDLIIQMESLIKTVLDDLDILDLEMHTDLDFEDYYIARDTFKAVKREWCLQKGIAL